MGRGGFGEGAGAPGDAALEAHGRPPRLRPAWLVLGIRVLNKRFPPGANRDSKGLRLLLAIGFAEVAFEADDPPRRTSRLKSQVTVPTALFLFGMGVAISEGHLYPSNPKNTTIIYNL